MHQIITTDLDQTIIFSPRSAGETNEPHQVVETIDGRTISLMADRTRKAIATLENSTFVPTTTRTIRQLQRIDLGTTYRWAIAASGGVVLHDGEIDQEWAEITRERLTESGSPIEEIRNLLAVGADKPWLEKLNEADGHFLVGLIVDKTIPTETLTELQQTCSEHGWRAVHQGRKLYVLPTGLHKAHAVQHIRAKIEAEHGPSRLVAAGDTLLDREMLAIADEAWVPRGSELDRLEATKDLPYIHLTENRGLEATVEIAYAWANGER